MIILLPKNVPGYTSEKKRKQSFRKIQNVILMIKYLKELV